MTFARPRALARLRVAVVFGSLGFWACNGRLEFDVRSDAGTPSGFAGSAAGTASGSSGAAGGSVGGGSGAGGSAAGAAGRPPVDVCEQCAAHGMRCRTSSPECVECLEDADCQTGPDDTAIFCDPQLARCVPCTPNVAQGGGCERGRVCFGWSHSCVRSCATEVDPDHDCMRTMKCDLTSYVCLACESDADCEGSATGPRCVAGGVRCGACTSDADCGGDRPHCDPLSFECVGCRDMRDCPPGAICLLDTQTCGA